GYAAAWSRGGPCRRSGSRGAACPWSDASRRGAAREGSSRQRREQGRRVVAALVEGAVDEERRRAANDSRGFAACDVASDASHDGVVCAIAIEACDVEIYLIRICAQVVVLERLLTVKEQFVHLPEAPLLCCRLGCRSRCECVGMYLRQREVAEGEA